jgi:catechol 2,3-dioxygenase-like lactoylglutathione lyase family enzyme
MSAITHLYAGVPVTDLHTSVDWYTRLLGRGPDVRAGDKLLWEIEEHAPLFIEPDSARAGTGRLTLSVVGLDALLEALVARHIDRQAIEIYSNGVRHAKMLDPDGNAIALAESPDVA